MNDKSKGDLLAVLDSMCALAADKGAAIYNLKLPAKEVKSVVIEMVDAIRSAREWHLGDKYRFGDASEQLAWKDQLALYDSVLDHFRS